MRNRIGPVLVSASMLAMPAAVAGGATVARQAGEAAIPSRAAVASTARRTPYWLSGGADETDSACPGLPAGSVAQVVLPGGHHLDGNASLLATSILAGLK